MYDIGIDEKRFSDAVALARGKERRGIGEQDEKLLHAAVKNYFAPPGDQEVPMGGFIADAVCGGEIFEVQTGSCFPLKKKLPALLQTGRVTVVYPIMREKTLFWIDKDTGERSPARHSPKRGAPCDVLPELLYLDPFMENGNFTLMLFFYDGEEYRLKDGWGNGGKRGAHRVSRVPVRPVGITAIERRADYAFLLPPLPGEFTASVFSKSTKRRGRALWACLTVLTKSKTLIREKRGRGYVYRVNVNEEKGVFKR